MPAGAPVAALPSVVRLTVILQAASRQRPSGRFHASAAKDRVGHSGGLVSSSATPAARSRSREFSKYRTLLRGYRSALRAHVDE
jgi:hypothetical protein